MIGNVGARSRLVYTAMGDTMNLASRLEGLARFYGVSALASRATRDAAGPGVVWRRVDSVRVKGKQEPVEIFELLGNESEVSDSQREFAAAYEAALEAYTAGEFRAAVAALESLCELWPDDLSVQRLLGLARQSEVHPPRAGLGRHLRVRGEVEGRREEAFSSTMAPPASATPPAGAGPDRSTGATMTATPASLSPATRRPSRAEGGEVPRGDRILSSRKEPKASCPTILLCSPVFA